MRTSKIFLYILVFLLPFSTGKVFLTKFSFYGDYNIFYHNIWIYLTDILIFSIIFLWVLEILWFSREKSLILFKKPISHHLINDKIALLVLIFVFSSSISVIFSQEILLGSYGFIRLLLFVGLFFYIKENINISREIRNIFWIMLSSAWIQSFIAITQYFRQKSIGLKILGESYFLPGMKGVAEFFSREMFNESLVYIFPNLEAGPNALLPVIRAYGTFPHPNVFSGFLLICWLINMYLLYFPYTLDNKYKISREIMLSISLILISLTIVIGFSRIVWISLVLITFLLIVIILYLRKHHINNLRSGNLGFTARSIYKPERLLKIIVVLLITISINGFLFSQSIIDRVSGYKPDQEISSIINFSGDESITDRVYYNKAATKIFMKNPIFGAGPRNFILSLGASIQRNNETLPEHMYQPVHNIYLLLMAEGGIVTLFIFILLIIYIVRRIIYHLTPLNVILVLIFFGILFIGFFDHYWLSIQQGGLLFWITLGLMAAKHDKLLNSKLNNIKKQPLVEAV